MERKYYLYVAVILLLAFFAAQYSQSKHSLDFDAITGNAIAILPEDGKQSVEEKEEVIVKEVEEQPKTVIGYILQWFSS